MKNIRIVLFLLAVAAVMSSCHAPKVEETFSYSVSIYPNSEDLFTLHNGQVYTFYAVITPESECSDVGAYHWLIGSPGQLGFMDSGDISVEQVRKELSSKYAGEYIIPDDSYCSYCTVKASTYSIGTLAVQISYLSNSTKQPSCTKYMRVTW